MQDNWQLFLGALLAFVAWRSSMRLLHEKPLTRRLPALVALVDLLILPGLFIVSGTLLRLAMTGLGLSEMQEPIYKLTLLLAYLAAGWALARLIEFMLVDQTEEDLSERVPKIVIGLIYFTMLLLALGIFLWQRGYSFTGIWVSTGVAAGVLGFALQKTLGDLFSGIALGIERPFRLGDWVELTSGTVGQVVDLNWRATRLRGWDNSTHIIPNSMMAGQPIKNLHDPQHLYAPWYFVKIPADVDPRFACALLLDAALRCESVLTFPCPVVRLNDGASLPYTYMVWVHLKNYPAMFRARDELYREIRLALRDAGIEVAAGVQEVRMRRAVRANAEPPSIELALRSLAVGALLTDEELERVAASSDYRHFNSGQVILAEGAASDAFYVVAGGLVEAAVTLPNRTRKVTETLGPGQYFGMNSMLTNDPSFLEFSASSDVHIIYIDLECVRSIISERPELADRLAPIIKQRLDVAEAARAASRQPTRRLSVRDIRQRIEGLVSRPSRKGREDTDGRGR